MLKLVQVYYLKTKLNISTNCLWQKQLLHSNFWVLKPTFEWCSFEFLQLSLLSFTNCNLLGIFLCENLKFWYNNHQGSNYMSQKIQGNISRSKVKYEMSSICLINIDLRQIYLDLNWSKTYAHIFMNLIYIVILNFTLIWIINILLRYRLVLQIFLLKRIQKHGFFSWGLDVGGGGVYIILQQKLL